MRRIDLDTRYELSKTARNEVYWIAVDWHRHSVHDAASFTDLQALATLVRAP